MHRTLVVAAAAPVSAPAGAATGTATRRQAADVVVVGSSLQAYAAAYLLAKRGKRTVLVEHAAPQLAPSGRAPRPDVVLHLPAATPHLVNEATESLVLWRGVEAASGARPLLQLCGSVDMAPTRGSSAASEALGAMQDASKAAGLSFGMLSAEGVAGIFPRLRPPRSTAGLYTNLGGVLNGRLAASVLLAMAQRAGADVVAASAAPAGRCLLGWRDAGGHFELRTAATADAAGDEVVYECEQLVLLPEAAAQRQTLGLFGVAVPGARLWQVPAARWRAQEECAALPVWQLMGTNSRRLVDDPSALDCCWGLPVLDWAPGSMVVAQCLADGEAAEPQQQASEAKQQQDAERYSESGASSEGAKQQQWQQHQAGDAGAAAAAATAAAAAARVEIAAVAVAVAADAAAVRAAGYLERPDSEEAVDAQRQGEAQQELRQQLADQRMAAAGSLAGRLVNGLGGRVTGKDGSSSNGSRGSSPLQYLVTPDGESAAGSHPGYEPGRVVAAFPATGATAGCLPGSQLAPLVAQLALSQLLGQPPEAVSAALVALERQALQAEALGLRHDSWGELSRNL